MNERKVFGREINSIFILRMIFIEMTQSLQITTEERRGLMERKKFGHILLHSMKRVATSGRRKVIGRERVEIQRDKGRKGRTDCPMIQ